MIAFKHQQHASILAHLHGEWSFAWVKIIILILKELIVDSLAPYGQGKMIKQVCYAQMCCGCSSHWDGVHLKGECIQRDFVLL